MCKIIAIANQKGGVAKTTTTINLGVGLSKVGKRVMLIDADPQGHLTMGLGFPKNLRVTLKTMMENIIMGLEFDPREAILHHEEGIDVIPSNKLLSGMDMSLFTVEDREKVLKEYLELLENDYDYILIDAPPTLGGWVMNILCASDKVIIPVEASPWGMFGLANMFEFLNEVRQISPDLEIAGIAVTKVDTRKNYYKQTMETLHELEDIHVFEQIIRVDSSVEWSQDNSIPVVEYKRSSRSAKEYTKLAEEVMKLCQ